MVNADLVNQVSVAAATFKNLLNDATTTWNGNGVKLVYTQSEVQENQAALRDFAAKIGAYISYKTADMTN